MKSVLGLQFSALPCFVTVGISSVVGVNFCGEFQSVLAPGLCGLLVRHTIVREAAMG